MNSSGVKPVEFNYLIQLLTKRKKKLYSGVIRNRTLPIVQRYVFKNKVVRCRLGLIKKQPESIKNSFLTTKLKSKASGSIRRFLQTESLPSLIPLVAMEVMMFMKSELIHLKLYLGIEPTDLNCAFKNFFLVFFAPWKYYLYIAWYQRNKTGHKITVEI